MTKATSRTSAKTAAIKSSLIVAEDATLQNIAAERSAITVQATSPAPITADISTALETFTARPAVAQTLSALVATGDGIKSVWVFEQENRFGRSVVLWGWDTFSAIALPLLSLLWLAINNAYTLALKPETRAAAAEKWAELKVWAAPKFDYNRAATDK